VTVLANEENLQVDGGRGGMNSLQKALAVLDMVGQAQSAPRIAEIAKAVGISRPTAYRTVQSLIAAGYLMQDEKSGRIIVGYSVLTLSASVLNRNRLRLEALPHLQSLAEIAQDRVNLGILYRNQVLYLAGVEKPSLPALYSRFGHTAPAHCSSLGKAILACWAPEDVRTLLGAEPLTQHTPHSITDEARFFEDLELTKRRGYALDQEEHVIASNCVAMPIMDAANRPGGAIGISGRSVDELLKHVDMLRHTADVISHHLRSE
jgi:IclR family acetate operon transcriptional repressor